jgi:hypothetical protein
MLNPLSTFFDHSRHTLTVRGLEATLDVLAFDGEEQLSQPFKYRIEFTSSNHDIAASDMLRRQADFSLHAAPHDLPPVMPWDAGKVIPPLRTLHGVVTGFKRLSGSNDEARYEITLQPRLALLERGRQFRIYQHQSVPEIVENILRSRHDFEGQDFLFDLVREYPKREQVIQLQARDECRHNFALNSVQRGHPEISLPGVHSDVGGGYLPRAREKVLLTAPQRVNFKVGRKVESTPEWAALGVRADTLRASGLAGEGSIKITVMPHEMSPQGKKEATEQSCFLAIELDRPVRGELALIALRLMRELGVRHGVPFKSLEERPELALPKELQLIASQILEQALAGGDVSLDADQERLLRSRYVHQSSNWAPDKGFLVNKPATDNKRSIHPNSPQKGYPQ